MNTKTKTIVITVSLAASAIFYACTQQESLDDCGYTWYQEAQPSTSITVITVEDDRGMPEGKCKTANGCAISMQLGETTRATTIYINKQKEITGWGACNTRRHELRHANGENHIEEHMYTPGRVR